MLIAYKGFNPDLTCKGYKFKLDEWNTEEEANCFKNGLHCAEDPLDCLSYYPDWDKAVYYQVIADGDINESGDDTKISCTRMLLAKELSKEEFVLAACDYMIKNPMMKENSFVQREHASSNEGFFGMKIVRGKHPGASGRKGDIIALLKEEEDSRKIVRISMFKIDGVKYRPYTTYHIKEGAK